ncbi:MAG: antibiotic biosynthesis monooxygenase [Gluconacetobacter diazotrophicus]|nr:antibiotic biosynthesis monooxygenase [Gluconacetobacter diazotrophicus]
MTDSVLTVVAVTRAKPGKAADLRAAQERLVADTLREEGCLGYALHQSLDDEHVLVFVERWESETLWRAHMTGEAMQRFRATGAGDHFADSTLHRLHKVAG